MIAQTATKKRFETDIAEAAAAAQVPAVVAPGPTAPRMINVPAAKEYPPKIAKALMAVTREFGAIKKDGWNDFHKYHYQKWEDVLERESILLAQHGIIIQQSEVTRSLLDKLISITYDFTIINEDGDVWPDRPVFTAIARLQDNKGMFDDKAANKCHTQAHKYFLLHTFKVRTREIADSDADEDGTETKAAPKPPKPGSAEAKVGEPRALPVSGKSYATWSDDYIAAIKTAKSVETIAAWAEANADSLAKVEGGSPENFERIKKAAAGTLRSLTPKPPKPQSQVATMPNPSEDMDGFKAWVEAKLAAVKEPFELEDVWNEHIAPRIDGYDQIAQEEAMGIYRTHEARLAP